MLSGFLVLASLWFYLRYAMAEKAEWKGGYLAGALVCCLASLLAKASAMSLPFVLVVLDVYPLRRLGGVSGWWRGASRRVWIEKLPFLLMAVTAAIGALIAQGAGGDVRTLAEHDMAARFAQACYGLVFYLVKMVAPVGLGPLYEIPAREVLMGPMFYGSLAALVVIVVVAVKMRRAWPGLAAALLVYAVVVAPVLGFAQSGPQLVADRYSYLSCLGFAVLAGALWLRSFRADSWWAGEGRRLMLLLLTAGMTTALFFLTFVQTEVWDSAIPLWSRGVEVSPRSAIAHVNLADALANRWEYEAAIEHYRRGIALDPADAMAHDHYARVLREVGLIDEAIQSFAESVRLDPHRPATYQAMGELLARRGYGAEAVGGLARRHGAQPGGSGRDRHAGAVSRSASGRRAA